MSAPGLNKTHFNCSVSKCGPMATIEQHLSRPYIRLFSKEIFIECHLSMRHSPRYTMVNKR